MSEVSCQEQSKRLLYIHILQDMESGKYMGTLEHGKHVGIILCHASCLMVDELVYLNSKLLFGA